MKVVGSVLIVRLRLKRLIGSVIYVGLLVSCWLIRLLSDMMIGVFDFLSVCVVVRMVMLCWIVIVLFIGFFMIICFDVDMLVKFLGFVGIKFLF